MFQPVSPNVSFPELDAEQLTLWEENRIFDKAVEQSEGRPPFVFFEGPPTANGMPHPGHVLTRIMKDVFLRYRTMCGYYVPRRAGWDTHGLPVEVEVEKALGISGREAIAEYGVEAFSKQCIDSVFKYIGEWRRMTQRIGFWVDLDDPYVTFHKSYVESVWWALSASSTDEDLLYQGLQGGLVVGRRAAPRSVRRRSGPGLPGPCEDPSIVMRFPVAWPTRSARPFLSWTTTPWTVPSATSPSPCRRGRGRTSRVADGGRRASSILAKARVDAVIGDKRSTRSSRPRSTATGSRAPRLSKYLPTFAYRGAHRRASAYEIIVGRLRHPRHRHRRGADGARLRRGRLPRLQGEGLRLHPARSSPDGTFAADATDFAGRFCKDADRDIIRNLRARDLHRQRATPTYRARLPVLLAAPTDDPLIQYARPVVVHATPPRVTQPRPSANNQADQLGSLSTSRTAASATGSKQQRGLGPSPASAWWGTTAAPVAKLTTTCELAHVLWLAQPRSRRAQPGRLRGSSKSRQGRQPRHSNEDLMVHKPWIDKVTVDEGP